MRETLKGFLVFVFSVIDGSSNAGEKGLFNATLLNLLQKIPKKWGCAKNDSPQIAKNRRMYICTHINTCDRARACQCSGKGAAF